MSESKTLKRKQPDYKEKIKKYGTLTINADGEIKAEDFHFLTTDREEAAHLVVSWAIEMLENCRG